MTSPLTRREFLDNSGKTVAGVAAGLSLHSTLASAQAAGAEGAAVSSNAPGNNVETRNQRSPREDARAGANPQNLRSSMSKILLAGEQVTASGFEIKGFDYFGVNAYKEDGQTLVDALSSDGHQVNWLRTCQVPTDFPERMEDLRRYDVVILSDVGANSLLFHPEMLSKSIRHPNRLKLIRDYVAQGGGLVMIGGWMSFAGIDGRARYHGTAVAEALPVTCSIHDDRQEVPEGVVPEVRLPTHPVLDGVKGPWPFFLGYNRVVPKPKAEVLLTIGDDPLLAVCSYERGRSAAFMSDCAPHWAPPEFLNWAGYRGLWRNLVRWLNAAAK
jgi:uncharacterized membrane protein